MDKHTHPVVNEGNCFFIPIVCDNGEKVEAPVFKRFAPTFEKAIQWLENGNLCDVWSVDYTELKRLEAI